MMKNTSEMNYEYFMQTDVSKYIGEWIAILENKVIAHNHNLKEVVSKANLIAGGKKYLLAKVPSEETMIF
jgi:hypothetical protein